MAISRAYEELVDFIAGGTSPVGVAEFRPSRETQDRLWELVSREKGDGLSPDEAAELQSYLQLEHIVRLAKARARQRLRLDRAGS
ncbi:MAG TPA: hypothetical protein VGN26_20630 [Armatimonadota bacterium]|jgi:hypothetical protein